MNKKFLLTIELGLEGRDANPAGAKVAKLADAIRYAEETLNERFEANYIASALVKEAKVVDEPAQLAEPGRARWRSPKRRRNRRGR